MGVEEDINTNKTQYIDLTHELNNYNEIYNLNIYLQKMHNVELDKLSSTDQRMRTMSLKSKQTYFLTDYAIKEYAMRCNLMYFTLVVVCGIVIVVSLFFLNRLSKQTMTVVVSVVLIAWAIIIYAVVKVNANRRKLAYDQYYWKNIKKTQ